MARINIEDSIYRDIRFIELYTKLGDLDRAIGALVRAWSLGQKWYLTPEKTIPESEWISQKICVEIIEVGLAHKEGGKIRLEGADKQFAWLQQRSDSGKKGGLKSQENRTSGRQSGPSGAKPLTPPPPQSHVQTKEKRESELLQNTELKTQIDECCMIWGKTLCRYGINKDPWMDASEIGRWLPVYGVEKLKLALRGAALENSRPGYDPAKNCRITRLQKKETVDLWVNLGAQQPEETEWKAVTDAV